MTPDEIIGHHQALAACPGWHSWLEPQIRALIDTATTASRRDADPAKREEARLTANALDDLLTDIKAQFQGALLTQHQAGKLPPYMLRFLDIAPDAPPAAPSHQPGIVANTDFDITTFGQDLIAKMEAQIKPPTQPPQIPPEQPTP